MTYSFTIPRPPVSTNRAVKMHWAVRAKLAKGFKADAQILARAAALPRPFTRPVRITVTGFYPKRYIQADHDNMSLMRKWIIDGIVAAGCVLDDNPEHVVPGEPRTAQGLRREVLVEVEEVY